MLLVLLIRFFRLAFLRWTRRLNSWAALGVLFLLVLLPHGIFHRLNTCLRVGCFFAKAARYLTLNSCNANSSFCVSFAISGNERFGFVQASPDFHSHVIVTHVPFLGNGAVVQPENKMFPQKIVALRLGTGQQFHGVFQIVPDGGDRLPLHSGSQVSSLHRIEWCDQSGVG
jgi:hypothetical protein